MKKAVQANIKQAVKRTCSMNDYVVKRPRLESQDNEENLNLSTEITYKKRTANPLDSSDSDVSEYENGDCSPMSIDEKNVLDYFNNENIDDLSKISGCSETKARFIIKNRPFHKFEDLSLNKINQKMIDGCLEILVIKQNLSELLKKCEKISYNLMQRIKPLVSSVDLESSLVVDNMIQDQPQFLNPDLQLKSYQMVGINWLRIVHEENLNGILADEMGLGKTVQTIAFLSYLLSAGHTGPHIVIVPTSTLNNWEREIRKWCPELSVIVYYGNQEERRQLRYEISHDKSFHVLLTTYNLAVSSKDDRLFVKKMDFHYGVFDEAHMLKNMLSIRYKYLNNFKIQRKLLLTGTPLQNNLLELISLLSFVMPNIFMTENEGLKKIFKVSENPSSKKSSFNEERMKQIKEMLAPFCLRRLKSQVLAQLPSKIVEVTVLPLDEDQSTLYKRTIEKTKNEQNQYQDLEQKLAISRIMELRKISHHSLLTRRHYTDAILWKMSEAMLFDEDHLTSDKELIFEDLSYMHDSELDQFCLRYEHVVGKYKLPTELLLKSNKIQYLDENLPKFIENGDKILIFSQFTMVLDILGRFLDYREITHLRLDGSTSANERQVYIDQFNENNDIKVFILSTKAGGLGINLTSANVVIIHDIDYNPYNDRQAEDRSHRLGQLREVRVFKLISKGTIDECMLQIANEKLKLEQITINCDDEDESKSSSSENKDVDFGSLLKHAMDLL